MAAVSSALKIKVDLGKALEAATRDLLKRQVFVGIPGSSPREPEPGEKNPPNNAVIAYMQEYGDEEHHVPARPFLLPGVEAATAPIVKGLKKAGEAALTGDAGGRDAGFAQAGLAAQASVKKTILTGEFAPLAESTLKARARRRNGSGKLSQAQTSKAARAELAARAGGADASTDARPLYDTHSMFNAVTYVVQDKSKG